MEIWRELEKTKASKKIPGETWEGIISRDKSVERHLVRGASLENVPFSQAPFGRTPGPPTIRIGEGW
jgi:hypothetical protein